MPTTSTSPKTFHLFPRLPWELRARIWELTISPRTVHIQVKHRNERDDHLNYRIAPVSYKIIFTCTTPFIPAAAAAAPHVCQEARHHLTYPLPSNSKKEREFGFGGYYEKVSASDLSSAAERRSLVWEKESEAQFSDNSARYIWVNFAVDMIDIVFRRFSLAANYASKIRRVRFKVKMSSGPILDVLSAAAAAAPAQGCGGRYALPNVREVEIDCLSFDCLAECLVRKPVGRDDLVCRIEDVVYIDPRGERMTLVEVLDLAQTRERQQSV